MHTLKLIIDHYNFIHNTSLINWEPREDLLLHDFDLVQILSLVCMLPSTIDQHSMIILFFIRSFHDHSRFDQSWVMTTLNLIIHDHSLIDHSMISSRLIMIKSCVHIHWIPIQFEALMNIEDQISPLSLRLNLEMWSTSCNMSIAQVTITTRFYSS